MKRSNTRRIILIGAGSVGSTIALELALMGRTIPTALETYDDDTVEAHNPTNQLYRDEDVRSGEPHVYKVDALVKILGALSNMVVTPRREKVTEHTRLVGTVIVAVHNMRERKKIFQAVRFNAGVPLFIDTRSGGAHAIAYVINPCDPDHVAAYESTLYDESESAPEPCADAHTIPTLWAIAAVVARILEEYARNPLIPPQRVLINFDGLPIIGGDPLQKE